MEIGVIREKCVHSKIKWYKHAVERMQERDIGRDDVRSCILSGEIIEEYPDDFPNPSCLIFGHTIDGKALHVVVSEDNETIGVITAYYPNLEKFNPDLKTRRR